MPDVTIYQDPQFTGVSQSLPKGRYNDALGELAIGNDTLSSLQVPPGLVARLYEHSHFQGRFIDIKEDTPDISQFWHDRTSSIVIYEETDPTPSTNQVIVFEHSDYGGASQILEPGKYNLGQVLIGDKRLSSALVPYGMVLKLFDQPDFGGVSFEIRNDTPAISLEWNDRATSIIVFEAPVGLWKTSNQNAGLIGESSDYNGVRGLSHSNRAGTDGGGVVGVNDNNGPGVAGWGKSVGVWGESQSWIGVFGKTLSTTTGAGVMGEAPSGSGVMGISKTWVGVYGETQGFNSGAGVWGEHKGVGSGVFGKANDNNGIGVLGESPGDAVRGISKNGVGVHGETQSPSEGAGVWGEHRGSGNGVLATSAQGVGIYAKGQRLAGFFEGDVEVTGDIRLNNADCAEDFDICEREATEPGTVMVVGDEGKLQQSQCEYDKRVAGVVSGAGAFKPGIVLDKQQSEGTRQPIALLGKVYCKVDTRYAAIEVGDLLTTSPTPGHAMKAADPVKAFGAVIGKALAPISRGTGMIPILVALQ
jgi:hypothetical protein